jgi:hypothetical protein
MEHELEKWNAQWFPQYFPLGPVGFLSGSGTPNGNAGSRARLSKDIPNWPILFLGVRISSVYELPAEPSELDLRTYAACKLYVDDEQTVEVKLSQQNIVADPIQQTHLTGKAGIYWAPFSVPFPMAGGNNISIEITRSTRYPSIGDPLVQIVPQVYVSLICAVAKRSEQTIAPHRAFGPAIR